VIRASDLSPEVRAKLGIVSAPKKRKSQPSMSVSEEQFAFQCRAFGLPPFVREYKFALDIGRMWRFDFCWPEYKVATECEGLVVTRRGEDLFVAGRHAHPAGFRSDCVKYATAMAMGWAPLRFEQTQVADMTALDMTRDMLKARGWK
jgi:hypothetical protein